MAKTAFWKYEIVGGLHFVILMGLFIRFIPWLISSEPISELSQYDLSNSSPPEWAMSFAINHGQAMYFKESIPSEEPVFAVFIVFLFIITVVSGYYFCRKMK